MARRTKEELLKEFHRLSDIFELTFEFQLSRRSEADVAWMRDSVPSRDDMLSWVERGEATLSQIVSGTREAINDNNEELSHAMQDSDPYAVEFLAFYRDRTGRDYYDDAGHPKKMARAILRRGKIEDETEWRFINGILSDTTQTTFKEKDVARLNRMLGQFEGDVRSRGGLRREDS